MQAAIGSEIDQPPINRATRYHRFGDREAGEVFRGSAVAIGSGFRCLGVRRTYWLTRGMAELIILSFNRKEILALHRAAESSEPDAIRFLQEMRNKQPA